MSIPNPRLRVNPIVAATALALTLSSFPALAEDWPVFRGPNGNGISSESGLKSSGQAETKWQTQVGLGYSSPVIAEGRVIVSGHDGKDTDTLWCLDEKTGEVIWKHSYPQPLGDLYFQGGTTGTATIDGDKVFHVARQGELFCLNVTDGAVIWSKHLQKDFGYTMPTWGFTGAPLVQADRLYVTAGESGLCLDKKDGATIWQSKDEEAGYATPFPITRNGKNFLIFTNKRAYVCVDAETGNEVWSERWMTRYGVNAADPVVFEDYLFISSGYGKGATLVKWDGNGDPETVWQNRDMKTQMNAAVLIDGHLYGVDGNEGQDGTGLKCLELLTGKTLWIEESVGHGTVAAAGGKLIVLTEQGMLQVADASPSGYSPSFSQQVLQPKVWTVPVFANETVYCRNAGGQFVALAMGE